MTKILFSSVVILTVLVGAAQPARAQGQTQTFMLVNGGAISGDSTVEGYKNWIDLYSITHALSGGGKGTACAVDVAKGIDSAGPRLWGAAVTGQVFAQIQIDIRKVGVEPFKFYEIVLSNARVTSILTMADQLMERLTLAADSVTLKFTGQNDLGQQVPYPPITVSCK